LKWEVDLGAVVFATPTVVAGESGESVAYVGTHSGRFVGVAVAGARAGEIVLDLDLGGRIWGTAAADDEGRLFVGSDDDKLYGIDPAAEKVLWALPLGSCQPTRAPGPEGARCDVDGGPTLGPKGDLFVGADGVYRVSRDGEIRWHWPSEATQKPVEEQGDGKKDGGAKSKPKPKKPIEGAHVFSTPLVTEDGKIYFGGQDGYVTSLDHDGMERWRYKVGRGTDVDGSPGWDEDGGIFVGADDGRVLALRSDGSLRWSFLAQKDIRSSVGVGPDGTLYVTSFDRNLYALSPGGEVRWVLPTGGILHSSPVVDARGTVYFGSQDDHLYAVSPEGEVRWAVEFPGDVDASVSLAPDGTLVVGCDDGRLRAYAAPAG
jgi:outer membrane protein assembly factor BamB